MSEHLRLRWAGYLVALVATAVTACTRWGIGYALGDAPPMMVLFIAPVMVAAWFAGLRSGLLATLLSATVGLFLFIDPPYTFWTARPNDVILLLSFIAVGVIISLLAEALHAARGRAEAGWNELHVTLSSIGDGVVTTDLHGCVTRLNPIAEALTGWSEQQAKGHPITAVFDVVNALDGEKVQNPVLRALKERGVHTLPAETVLVAKDGTQRPIDDSAASIRDTHGRICGAVLIFRDITERRQAEAALREREERFRNLADSAPVLIWSSGPDKQTTYLNKTWLDFTGLPFEAQKGVQWLELVHPEDRPLIEHACERAFREHESFTHEFRLRRADGAYRWMLDTGTPRFDERGTFLGIIGSCVDVTENRQAQERVQESERRLRLVSDALPALISYVDRDGYYRFANNRYEDWFGTPANVLVGRHVRELLGDHYLHRLPYIEQAFRGETAYFEGPVRHHRLGMRELRVAYVPDVGHDGAVRGFYVMASDITDRKITQLELEANQHRLHLAQEAGRVGVFEWLIPEDRNIWSPELAALYGVQ